MYVSSRLLRPTAAPPPAPADPSRRCRRLYSIPRSFDAGTPFLASLIVTARRPQGIVAAATSWSGPEGGPQAEERTYRDAPSSIELEPIVSEEQFDRIVAEAQQLEESLVVLWMANWCRKCIYLKPKLEKLAADYYPSIRFYCVDVNTVPQRLVNRAGITKMPTIQLWKDSQKQAQVIGGHKAWLVVDDVRRMIESGD